MSINNRLIIGQCPTCVWQYGIAAMPTLSGSSVVLCSGCHRAVLLSDWQKNDPDNHKDAAHQSGIERANQPCQRLAPKAGDDPITPNPYRKDLA